MESKKPIAVICPNGIIKFYKSDGTVNSNHPTGFYNSKHLEALKKDFTVKYAEDLWQK
jgi:hypothetical protein